MATRKTYSELLRSPRWQKKRLLILNRDNWACRCCGDKETTLNVHHLRYDGNPWEVDDSDLISVCQDCHKVIECGLSSPVLISKPFLKVDNGLAKLIMAYSEEGLHICAINKVGEVFHLLSLRHAALKSVVQFIINDWLREGREDNLIDFKMRSYAKPDVKRLD